MDHPWRFAGGGDICPVCSSRHFPFCHPPPQPFPYALQPTPPMPYDLRPPPPPPPTSMWGPGGFPTPPHPPPPHGLRHYELDEWEGSHKRMRVGEPAPLVLPPNRVSSEDERLLSLVRDHGRPPPPPLQADGFGYGGMSDPSLSYQNYNNYDAARFPPHERRDFERDFGQFGAAVPHERSDFAREGAHFHDSQSYRQNSAALVSDRSHNYASRGPRENYHGHAHQQINTSDNSLIVPHQVPRYVEASGSQHPEVMNSYSVTRPADHSSYPYPSMPLPPLPLAPLAPTSAAKANTNAPPSDIRAASPVPTANSTLFPVLSSASATASLPPSGHTMPETHHLSQANCYNAPVYGSATYATEGSGLIYRPPLEQNVQNGRRAYTVNNSLNAKPAVVNACHLFRKPLRATRPDHIVIILRGLPGSGKSYLAKALRDIEVENGGNAPRIHSMDDYFMIEVEKVEDNEGSRSSTASKGKRQLTKKVIEYCYEPEMEETYRSSMLKAFKKTLDEGNFTFVIVDDRNLRVGDFAQFWATAKRSGYEVYLLEAPYKDPTGCAARNVHGFTTDDIQKMAEKWEEAPSLYLRLDIQSLFHGDDLNEHSIQEVDMDTEDSDDVGNTNDSNDKEDLQKAVPKSPDYERDQVVSKPGGKWDLEEEDDLAGIKELGKSKWSKDFDEDTEKSERAEGNTNALSGLIQVYGMRGKSVCWGDQVEKGGFSIAAAKKRITSSLIIGPGSGYNLASNPLIEGNSTEQKGRTDTETKRQFSEQLRAERESFKAVFDRRRQRIGGLNNVDDD